MKNGKIYRERCNELAEWLEAGAPHKHIRFSMAPWCQLVDAKGDVTHYVDNACGAVCCMAGAAAQFFAPERVRALISDGYLYSTVQFSRIARVALGLYAHEAEALFVPPVMGDRRMAITPQQAARVLRHFLNTGEVWWTPEVMGE